MYRFKVFAFQNDPYRLRVISLVSLQIFKTKLRYCFKDAGLEKGVDQGFLKGYLKNKGP